MKEGEPLAHIRHVPSNTLHSSTSLSFILEFDRLLEKHATETGLPVIVDFYSDGCGPCRMMAPVFKKLAQQVGQDKAVFCKVDTNTMYEISSRYQIRSLPLWAVKNGINLVVLEKLSYSK